MSPIFAAMTEFEVIRLVGEVVALLAAVGAGVWRLLRQGAHLLEEVKATRTEVAAVKDRQVEMNGSVARHLEEDTRQFGQIGERLATIEGSLTEHTRHA